jgi:NTE family protein
MNTMVRKAPKADAKETAAPVTERAVKQQVVLVLQGGGALGAYQAGVYQALMEGGVEPDWVIGTSIGAINGALIAGNEPKNRIARLREFWDGVVTGHPLDGLWSASIFGNALANLNTIVSGIPGFFQANPLASWGMQFPVGIERASFYSTDALKATLGRLVDFDYVNHGHTRLTVGAVNVRTSEMRYFDSRDMDLAPAHIMASGALPPAFPAVCIDGDPYWDGGIYSNTPIEVVLDERPRRDSLIFSVNMWQPRGSEPKTIMQVVGRQKDIQYASRGKSHVARQEQIHRLRHVIRELTKHIPEKQRDDPAVQELTAYGCSTVMHLVRFLSPQLDGEDHTKDIDFSRAGIRARWDAGHAHARHVLVQKPWQCHVDALQGVLIHESSE